jgi:polyhydroxybutyrate depolymerase
MNALVDTYGQALGRPSFCARRLRSLRLLVVLFIGSLLAGVARPQADGAAANEGTKLGPGSFQLKLTSGERERTYVLRIPPSYSGQKPVPLVLLLHGRGSRGVQVERYSSLGAKADTEGFILACPDALGDPTTWNAGLPGGMLGRADDVGFLRDLIDDLGRKLSLDPDRIYVAGHSSGAMMSYRLAGELSGRIAAVGVVAGSVGVRGRGGRVFTIPDPEHPVSVIAFHGTADKLVPYDGGVSSELGVGFLSVAESVAFWAKHDGCSAEPRRETSQGGGVIKETYSGGKGGSEVVLYTIVGGNHMWPGMRGAALLSSAKEETSATDLMWDFFTRHPRAKETPQATR